MRGANRFAGPFFRDIGMIAEFRGSLAAGAIRRGTEHKKKQEKRKNFWTHGE
jgi:hypothetical protein